MHLSVDPLFLLLDSPRIPRIVFHLLCLYGSGVVVLWLCSKDPQIVPRLHCLKTDDLWRSKILRNFESVFFLQNRRGTRCFKILYFFFLNFKLKTILLSIMYTEFFSYFVMFFVSKLKINFPILIIDKN